MLRGEIRSPEHDILVDADNTIFAFDRTVQKSLAAEGVQVDIKQKTAFYMHDEYPEHKTSIFEIITADGFFRDMDPYEGAVEMWDYMEDKGFHMRVASSPLDSHPNCEQEKRDAIAKLLGDRAADEAIIQRDKTRIPGLLLIDDKPKITGSVRNPSWVHAVFTQPHNATENPEYRLSSWLNKAGLLKMAMSETTKRGLL